MRGLAPDSARAQAANTGLPRLRSLATRRCLAPLAWKPPSAMSQANARLRPGKARTVLTKTKEGKPTRETRFTRRAWPPPPPKEPGDTMPTTAPLRGGRSTLAPRLKASRGESGGKEGGSCEGPPGRQRKDRQGKEWWEAVMRYRKRKTRILCLACHDRLQAHKLSNRQQKC